MFATTGLRAILTMAGGARALRAAMRSSARTWGVGAPAPAALTPKVPALAAGNFPWQFVPACSCAGHTARTLRDDVAAARQQSTSPVSVLWPWQGMLPASAPSCLRSPNHHTARRFYHGSAAGIVAHHAPLTNPNRCPGSSRKPALPMAGGGGQLPWTGAGSGPFGNTHARFLFGGGVKSPYDVLEISSVATTKEIKFAYLDMARR